MSWSNMQLLSLNCFKNRYSSLSFTDITYANNKRVNWKKKATTTTRLAGLRTSESPRYRPCCGLPFSIINDIRLVSLPEWHHLLKIKLTSFLIFIMISGWASSFSMNLFERESDGRLIFSADGKQSEQQNSETAECLKSSSSRDKLSIFHLRSLARQMSKFKRIILSVGCLPSRSFAKYNLMTDKKTAKKITNLPESNLQSRKITVFNREAVITVLSTPCFHWFLFS